MLPLLIIAIPIVEIVLFIQVGGAIGAFPTIVLTVLTSLAGLALVRQHGVQTALKARECLNQGRMPVEEMFNTTCIIFGGLLLLLPGFFTDVLGLLLFFEPVRLWLRRTVENRGTVIVTTGTMGHHPSGGAGSAPGGPIIDADYVEVPPGEAPPGAEAERLPGDRS